MTGFDWPAPAAGPPVGDRPVFSVRTSDEGDARVIRVSGELDIASSLQFGEALRAACLPPPARIIVDASQLNFVDAGDLEVLSALQGRLLDEGREGLVVRGTSGLVRRIFDVMEMTSMLEESAAPRRQPGASVVASARFSTPDQARQAARMSVRELFVAYIALGGTADLTGLTSFLAGRANVLDRHQRDVLVHAINERLSELGYSDRLLSYGTEALPGAGSG